MADTKKPVVAFCQPVYNKIDPLTRRSERLLRRDGIVGGWHSFDIVGVPVDQARNELTYAALQEPDVTHLFWVDDDMVFPPDALARLLSYGLPFVGGLCFDRRHPYKPVIGRIFDPSWGFEPNTIGWLYDYPPDARLSVDMTGGAFLLVERGVFEKIREQEIRKQAVADGDLTEKHVRELRLNYRRWWSPLPWQGASEDLSFCERCRTVGVQPVVDTGLKIGHVGEVVVDEQFARHNRMFEYARWHPPLDALLDAIRMQPADEVSAGLRALDGGARQVPVATIVIPVYNQKPEHLAVAVKSALAQTVPVEVIVVDDGSTHCLWCGGDLVEVKDDVHVCDAAGCPGAPVGAKVVHHTTNLGISSALNTGIGHMTTDWFAWLSSDDFYEPDKIERHLTALLCAQAKAGYTGYHLKFDNGNSVGHVVLPLFNTREAAMDVLRNRCCINGSTVLLHTSVFREVGAFDTSYRYGQDWEFWLRVGEKFFWHGIPDKLTTRREFGNLTERLNRGDNPEATRRRNEEDHRIRTKYAKG